MGTYLIDNRTNHAEQDNLNYETVYSFLVRNLKNKEVIGNFDIVTGFITIGMLSKLYDLLESQDKEIIKNYRIILGDLVERTEKNERPIRLLNDIDNAFLINKEAKNAEKLLNLKKIDIEGKEDFKIDFRTTDPDFCHGKVYIFEQEGNGRNSFFIIGSSNLTEKGLGYIKENGTKKSNFEVNIAFDDIGRGQFIEGFSNIKAWFNELWKPENSTEIKNIYSYENGRKKKVGSENIRDYLLKEISNYYRKYIPKEIYYKILFEIYRDEIDDRRLNPSFIRQITQVEHTVIFQTLFRFQKEGVYNLINMIQKYNGAILADAVGLGKTWSALAVMKFFETENYDVVLFCPKKLEKNWSQYLFKEKSKFKRDSFKYDIFFHTDLQGNEESYRLKRVLESFQGSGKKLIVIDESHNLRNSNSQKYKNLMNKILKPAISQNKDIKVLLLSATPINNQLDDIKNQIMLIAKDDKKAFENTDMNIDSIDRVFNHAKEEFNNWYNPEKTSDDLPISNLVEKIPDFFKIIDFLSVSRTRDIITQHISEDDKKYLRFPDKKGGIDNQYKTPEIIGFNSFDDLITSMPKYLAAYKPYMYVDENINTNNLTIEQNTEKRLGDMINAILVKRLESSWLSFKSTLEVVLNTHQEVLNKVELYKNNGQDSYIKSIDEDDLEEEEGNSQLSFIEEEKTKLKISDLKNLLGFEAALKEDITSMQNIIDKLQKFETIIENENTIDVSKDNKLKTLMDKIIEKRANPINDNNNKVLIFTAYKDTALYLFNELKKRGFKNIGLVSGDYNCTDDSNEIKKDFDDILQRFAPYTKIFKEKEWLEYKPLKDRYDYKEDFSINYEKWKQFLVDSNMYKYELEKINNPIDILIATDCISEGQNLQDCDYVVNYDIHWNPVRVVQRMGRIDRLGSPNDKIKCLNFWPSKSVDEYLKLQTRIESKMIGMKFAGAEIEKNFTENLSKKLTDGILDKKQADKMLLQMATGTSDSVQRSNKDILFSDLSIQGIKNSLFYEMDKNYDKYKNMPHGIYSGFKAKASLNFKAGLIALIKHKIKRQGEIFEKLKLIYIDDEGKEIKTSPNEIIGFIDIHSDSERFVPQSIEECKLEDINKLSNSIKKWIELKKSTKLVTEDGQEEVVAGKIQVNNLINRANKKHSSNLKQMSLSETEQIMDYNEGKFELITWMIISND